MDYTPVARVPRDEVWEDQRESLVSGGAMEKARTELTQERRTAGGAMERSR